MMSEQTLEPSKYLPYFKENGARLRESLELFGDLILVERISFPEARVSGLFIPDSSTTQTGGYTSEKPQFFRVLLPGAGYYDEATKETIPLDINQGDIIYTTATSVKLWSSVPLLETTDSSILGLTRLQDVQIRFKGEAQFIQFLREFNQAVKGEVVKRNK